jgi:hypothetical protein
MSASGLLPPSSPPTGEVGRAFLQERLAFLGKSFCLIVLGFYLFGNLASMAIPGYETTWWVSYGANRVQIAAILLLASVWLLGRTGRLRTATLEALDAALVLLLCAL